jgi:hypothetical protein
VNLFAASDPVPQHKSGAFLYVADWLKDRLDGKPMQTKHMKVDAQGQVHESTFEEARKALSIPLQV